MVRGAVKPPVWRSGALGDVPHGFLGRAGGISTGAMASLNCGWGSGEDRAIVAENRRRAAERVLPGAVLLGLNQVHSADVITVAGPWEETERPLADAFVTNLPGMLLSIVTADCAPVLLADRGAGVIGAAHAGWKGALGGIIENTVAAMTALGARRSHIAAAVGPCIARASYEVGADFPKAFGGPDPRFFAPGKPGHWQFDLPAYVADRLRTAHVTAIEMLGRDTFSDEDAFFSYRRATLRGEPTYGRQLSLIGLLQKAPHAVP